MYIHLHIHNNYGDWQSAVVHIVWIGKGSSKTSHLYSAVHNIQNRALGGDCKFYIQFPTVFFILPF